MDKKIIFIADNSSCFTLNKINTALEEKEYSISYAMPDFSRIEEVQPLPQLFVIYADFIVKAEFMSALVEYCRQHSSRIALIGMEDEIAAISEQIPAGLFWKSFVRPVNTSRFTDELEQFYAELVGASKHRIMIVDDSPMTLRMITSWLNEKYDVTGAGSALEARKKLESVTPELILLDYEMPVCSGPEFFAELKKEAKLSKIPVIFLTGISDKDSLKTILELSPAGCLMKTLEPARIIESVDDFFEF